jgi:hypothetical protein
MRGIRGFPELRKLWLAYGEAVDWQEVAAVSSLEEIVVDGCRGIDVEAVSRLPNLRYLRMENAGTVRTLAPLRNHPTLETLSMWKTNVSDGDITLLDTFNGEPRAKN